MAISVKQAAKIAGEIGLSHHSADLADWISELSSHESRQENESSKDYLRIDLGRILQEQGIQGGRVLEIGGPHNSFCHFFPEFDWSFVSLYPVEGNSKVLVGDITQCDHIPSESFDAIFSTSVFEHIQKPWAAARHISRLLKPGGVSYHAAPFSYFYHGAPADFWRYTPDAFLSLFSDLRPLKAEFFGRNRRRDNRGSESNAVDRDGGEPFKVDAFGGWRENWFSIYAGVKDPDFAAEKLEAAKRQVVVNLMKMLEKAGVDPQTAAERVSAASREYQTNFDGELVREGDAPLAVTAAEALEIWERRGRNGVRPSYSRFAMAAKLGWV